MSLLMDALKKAEQEKREAARRLEEARERTHGAAAEAPPDPDITAEMESIPEPAAPAPSVELSLEPRASVTGPMELMARASPEPPSEGESPTSGEPSTVEPELSPPPTAAESALEFVDEIGPEAMADFDQTFHGVTLAEGAVPGLFDETLPGSAVPQEPQRSYDQTLPGVPAAQLARDIGTDQPTPAAAQTVFTAGHARVANPLYRWGLPAGGVALLLAVAVFVHNTVTPVAPNTPSPWVARGIEAVPPPADPLLPPAEASLAGPAAEVGGPAPEPVPGPAAEPADAVAIAEPEPSMPLEEATPEAAPPAAEPVVTTPPAETAPPVAIAAAAAAAAAPAPEPPPSLVRISRSRAPSEHDRMLREAYSYYSAGDYESATVHYLAVLNERPETLDALLGMGAIALKQGDLRRAADYFARVLKLDPRNQTATAALIGLQRNPDPTASESALKHLLQDNPDNPFLYFILGNVYAAQSRWAEAQQAFFDAYRNDSANPDYALNLAASLDRLGQVQPALDYYGVALKLAETQPAGFNADGVRARMQTLASGGPTQ